MTPLELIELKRDGSSLSALAFTELVSQVRSGTMRPYQLAAFNVAAAIRGLDPVERATLIGILAAEEVGPELLELPHIGLEHGLYGGQLQTSTRPAHIILAHKIRGEELTGSAIQSFVSGVTDGMVTDEELAAFTMAVYLRGMTREETSALTLAMLNSGDVLRFPQDPRPVVDKHSTGGVGDKVSLPLAGALIACGMRVPMLSGRGLGHTGGTLDKLQAIPGFRVDLTPSEIAQIVQDVGGMIIGQTSRLAPADKRMYAIRDVCGTVSSIPLITASILSKKLAEGISALVLDVKVGSGAFMKSRREAEALARSLVSVGEASGVRVSAILTDMEDPIGEFSGNANEVYESIRCLQGQGPADLEVLTVALGGELMRMTGLASTRAEGEARIAQSLHDGSALRAFRRMVAAQGGDPTVVDHPERLPVAPLKSTVSAPRAGVLTRLEAERIGRGLVVLGGGRLRQEDPVELSVGVRVLKTVGQTVQEGEAVLEVVGHDRTRLAAALPYFAQAIQVGDAGEVRASRILGRITASDLNR